MSGTQRAETGDNHCMALAEPFHSCVPCFPQLLNGDNDTFAICSFLSLYLKKQIIITGAEERTISVWIALQAVWKAGMVTSRVSS